MCRKTHIIHSLTPQRAGGWSGGAMVLGKLPVPGRPTLRITVGQGPTALAVGAGGGCFDIFTLICPFSPLSCKKMSKRPTPAPTANAVGPCPTVIQISRTHRHRKFTQHHRITRPPLRKEREMIDERKNVQTTPTRTYCKRSRPLSYYNPRDGRVVRRCWVIFQI